MEVEEIVEELFGLEADDEYESCCGEVFLTIKGNIIFHCTLCELKFKGFDRYENHLRMHYTFEEEYEDIPNSNSEEKIIAEEIKITPYYEDCKERSQEFFKNDDNIEVIIEREEEFPFTLKKITKIKTNKEKKSSQKKTKKMPTHDAYNDLSSKHKQCTEGKLDPELYHELPACDRPTLKRSRKPITSLTDDERKHKCPYCSFASKDKTNLWSHIQRHSNNKPHQCTFCPKNFHTRVELTFHTRYHTGERPFLCTECGRSFVTKEQLKQHTKRHNNQRDHKCTECDKLFFSAQELREHMTVHTKETPHKCDLCGSVFTRRKALIAHKKLHENKRSYKCQLCSAGFNQSAGLYLHFKTKHHMTKQNCILKASESV